MRKYFITGILVWAPLAATIWVLSLLVGVMDKSLLLIPKAYQPEALLGFPLPGVGAVLSVIVIFVTGLFTANIIGQRLVRFWENVLNRIPVVKSVYGSVKNVSDAVFADQGVAFQKVLLVRFPHNDTWAMAFQTAVPAGEVSERLEKSGCYIAVYVPTTPNPTSGYYIFARKEDVIELDMSVDVALKQIISMGLASPNNGTAASGCGKQV